MPLSRPFNTVNSTMKYNIVRTMILDNTDINICRVLELFYVVGMF